MPAGEGTGRESQQIRSRPVTARSNWQDAQLTQGWPGLPAGFEAANTLVLGWDVEHDDIAAWSASTVSMSPSWTASAHFRIKAAIAASSVITDQRPFHAQVRAVMAG